MKTKNVFAALAFGSLLLISCRETVTEREVIHERDVEIEKEEPEEDNEGIIERTGKKIDQEVNDEVNEEIEKIGDDN